MLLDALLSVRTGGVVNANIQEVHTKHTRDIFSISLYFRVFTAMFRFVSWALILAAFAGWTGTACVPDVPETLLGNSPVLGHPAVLEAFDEVGELLRKLYDDNVTRDGLSFAIVRCYLF